MKYIIDFDDTIIDPEGGAVYGGTMVPAMNNAVSSKLPGKRTVRSKLLGGPAVSVTRKKREHQQNRDPKPWHFMALSIIGSGLDISRYALTNEDLELLKPNTPVVDFFENENLPTYNSDKSDVHIVSMSRHEHIADWLNYYGYQVERIQGLFFDVSSDNKIKGVRTKGAPNTFDSYRDLSEDEFFDLVGQKYTEIAAFGRFQKVYSKLKFWNDDSNLRFGGGSKNSKAFYAAALLDWSKRREGEFNPDTADYVGVSIGNSSSDMISVKDVESALSVYFGWETDELQKYHNLMNERPIVNVHLPAPENHSSNSESKENTLRKYRSDFASYAASSGFGEPNSDDVVGAIFQNGDLTNPTGYVLKEDMNNLKELIKAYSKPIPVQTQYAEQTT